MRRLQTGGLIFILTASAGCEPSSGMRRHPTATPVRVKVGTSPECRCADSQYVSVEAQAGTRYTYTALERSLYAPASEIRVSRPVQGDVSRGLGCTIDRSPDDPTRCTVIRTFNVGGVMYPNDLETLSRERVLAIVAGRLHDASGGNQGAGHCAARCKAAGGDCPTYDGRTSGDVELGPRIAQLVATFDPNTTVGIGRIMELTSSGKNECGRTDIAGNGGVHSNAGSRCAIQSSLGPLGSIAIAIPDALQFRLEKHAVNRFTMLFDKAAGAPRLELSGGSLPSAYNGPVNRVDYIDGLYAVEVNGKCLGLLSKTGV